MTYQIVGVRRDGTKTWTTQCDSAEQAIELAELTLTIPSVIEVTITQTS